MPRINTRQAAEYVAELQPFTSNGAISGDWIGEDFVVKSYSTAIAVLYPEQHRAVINWSKYSATTSKHQALTASGIGRLLDWEVIKTDNPDTFTELTGHRARLRGANW